ncbi:putative pseudouridine synthase TruD/Pus7 [Pyronema omphalodes]|nr:putative pseudouridine synthase TruD/Pus7 [Pyronema omphalodes]
MASPPAKKARLEDLTPATSIPITNGTSVSQTAQEIAAGITEYVNPSLPAWTGILKQRYTDFLVNEVDLHGNVLHLTSTKSAGKAREIKASEKTNAPKNKEPKIEEPIEAPSDAIDRLSAFVPAEVAQQIIDLSLVPAGSTESLTTPSIAEKDARSSFHALVRELFKSRLITETSVTHDPPAIVVTRNNPSTAAEERRRSKRGGKNHNKNSWSELGGEYCHFNLYKENRDTMEVLSFLARLLKVNPKAFSFAGTKDRRAVTVQRCSAHMIRAERLAGLNTAGDNGLRGARLGDFEYKPYGLSLGDLGGNEFVITLRQAAAASDSNISLEDTVTTAVEAVKKSGFANYFGLQRFGSHDVSTADVGAYLLRTDWRGAVEKILAYDPALCGAVDKLRDDIDRAEACRLYFTYDFDSASAKMPRKFVAESAMLKYFCERGIKGDGQGKGLDYLGAIQAIPRGLRTMYAHAYQSFVWNHVLSARLKISRTEVLPGDLVLVRDVKEVEEEVDQAGEIVIAPEPENDNGIQRARPLSKEEAASGKWRITDVVLPIPGWDVVYPETEGLMQVYQDVMKKDSLDPRDMKRSVRDWSLTGSYRKIMSGFVDGACEVEVRRCAKGEQVVQTDYEKLQSKEKKEKPEAKPEAKLEATSEATPKVKPEAKPGVEHETEQEAEQQENSKRKREEDEEMKDADEPKDASEEETVVVIKMRLGTSCYATMALREIMKGGCLAYKPEFGR